MHSSLSSAFFIVYADKKGEWRFRLESEEKRSLLHASEGYKAKASVYKAIDSVRRNAMKLARFEIKENTRGKFYFALKARNGLILAIGSNFEEFEEVEEEISFLI